MPFHVRSSLVGSEAFKKAAKDRQARNRGKGGGGIVAGTFDYLKLVDIPIHIRIPPQLYTYQSWDRDAREVVDVIDAPYLEFPSHFYRRKTRTIYCSAGAYRKDPCYGCAIEKIYWDGHHEQEDLLKKQGMDVKLEKNPPSNRSLRNGMAVVGVDNYFEVPLTDKNGKPRKNKAGEVIKRYVAEPLARFPAGTTFPHKVGHNMHWSFPGTHLTQLENMNERLELVCASCGSDMYASKIICAVCAEIEEDFGTEVEGEDLFQLKREKMSCSKCHSDEVIPFVECSNCNDPKEGGLLDFDLRIKAVPVDDKKTDLELVGWRLPNYSEDLNNLYASPLNIEKIYAPTALAIQKNIFGDLVEDVDPSAGAFTESYSEPSSESEGEEGNAPF